MAAAPSRVISLPAPEVVTVESARPTRALQSTILYGTAGLLMFGPLAFGAVEPWSVFVVEAGSAALFLMWVAKTVLSPTLRFRYSPLFAPMLLFAGVVALQLVVGTTVYRYATVSGMLQYIAYGALCFVALQALETTSDYTKFARLLAIFGFSVSFFALIQSLSSNGKLYWLRTPRFGGWIYGPYVNHNHYAGLMEMLAPIPLLLCFNQKSRGARKFFAGFAALLMAATIFLSGSRGGMVAFAIEAVLLVAIVCKQKRVHSLGTTIVFAILLGTTVTWLGWTSVGARWRDLHLQQAAELSAGGRLMIYKDALHMFAQRPLLGWGLGNFVTAYPQFRSFYTDLFVNAAHNDYLQMLVESGLLGALAMIWFVVILCRRAAQHWRTSSPIGIPAAALVGCAGILVHSLVDFNLQIPANAGFFYLLAVIGTAPPES
jgi:O-antigen ligase